MASTFRQEMPPEGGYRSLCFQRIPAKKYFSVPVLIAINILPTVVFHYTVKYDKKVYNRKALEDRSALIALQPMIEAERDREYLRQVQKNREDEADLMKNVPGWEVGTLYGEPVYKTIPEDTLIAQSLSEYYVNTRFKYFTEFMWFRLKH